MSDYVYIAVKPCGDAAAICVDDPDHKKDTAKFVAAAVRDGYSVQHVKRDVGIERLKRCGHGTIKEQLSQRRAATMTNGTLATA